MRLVDRRQGGIGERNKIRFAERGRSGKGLSKDRFLGALSLMMDLVLEYMESH